MKSINILKTLAILGLGLGVFAACNPEEKEDNKEPEEPKAPKTVNVTLTAAAEGETLTYTVEGVEGEWKLSAAEKTAWITPSYEGAVITLEVAANQTGEARSAVYNVKQEENVLIAITVNQASMAAIWGEKDMAFIQAAVENETFPNLNAAMAEAGIAAISFYDDTEYAGDDSFLGVTFGYEKSEADGLYHITQIWDNFTVLPDIDLPELTHLWARGAQIHGDGVKTVITDVQFNTPKLARVDIASNAFTGVFPASLAAQPALAEFYADWNDFYGALPHEWGSTVLEVFIMGGNSASADHNPDLGYVVPKTLDVVLNTEKSFQGDKTQLKLGGAGEGHFIGYEKGWGQARSDYFKNRAGAATVAEDVWDDTRLFNQDDTVDPDNNWAWYFNNLPAGDAHKMVDWDQTAADAYTASVETARGI